MTLLLLYLLYSAGPVFDRLFQMSTTGKVGGGGPPFITWRGELKLGPDRKFKCYLPEKTGITWAVDRAISLLGLILQGLPARRRDRNEPSKSSGHPRTTASQWDLRIRPPH